MHVGQATTRQPRLDGVKPVCGGIERVQPARIAHARPQGEGFASCACTKIHDHFATMGVYQQRQQLRPLILYLDVPALKQLQPCQRWFPGQPQTPG